MIIIIVMIIDFILTDSSNLLYFVEIVLMVVEFWLQKHYVYSRIIQIQGPNGRKIYLFKNPITLSVIIM